jgi:hypothetical protein
MPNEISSRTNVIPLPAKRRIYMRRTVGAPATLMLPDDSTECLVRDNSAGGACVRASLILPLGIELGLAGSRTLHIPSRVVRATSDAIGLEFLIDETEKDCFVQFILNGLLPSAPFSY